MLWLALPQGQELSLPTPWAPLGGGTTLPNSRVPLATELREKTLLSTSGYQPPSFARPGPVATSDEPCCTTLVVTFHPAHSPARRGFFSLMQLWPPQSPSKNFELSFDVGKSPKAFEEVSQPLRFPQICKMLENVPGHPAIPHEVIEENLKKKEKKPKKSLEGSNI